MALRVGVLVRAGSAGAFLRHRVASLRALGIELHILALRVPARRAAAADPAPVPLHRRVVGKLRGMYARLNYPPRYYDLNGVVGAAEERYLPPAPPLESYTTFREYDVPMANSPETAALVRACGIDVLLPSVGLVRQVLLDAAPLGCLNTHYAWLPGARGLWSTVYAIVEDRPDWIGVTVHRMDTGIDTGPILARERPRFSRRDTHETLWVRHHLVAARLLGEVLTQLEIGGVSPIPNPPDKGVYRSRPSFAQHLRLEWTERRFFRRYGDPACPPLESAGTIVPAAFGRAPAPAVR